MPALLVIPQAVGITWKDWSDTVLGYAPDLQARLPRDATWREFGDAMTLFYPSTPGTDMFSRWEDWADAVKLILSS